MLAVPGLAVLADNPDLGPTPWPGAVTSDPRFGAVQASERKEDGNNLAQDLGLHWTRELYLWDTLGNNSEATRVGHTERYFETSLKVVGLIQFTPPYAGANGNGLNPPAGIRLPWNDPGNHFGKFCYDLAKWKAGKTDTWIIWNEPDICKNDQFGYAWTGTVEDYYYMLKTGYQAIKAANPNAQVLFASLGIVHSSCCTDGTDTTFFNKWLEVAKQDNAAAGGWYFDGLSLNIHKEPERIYEMVKAYKAKMQQNGFDKPIWLMETSVPLAGDGSAEGQDYAVSKDTQQSYLIQAYANALAAGADHLAVYKLGYFPPQDPAYTTLHQTMKYMSGVQTARKTPDIGGQAAYRYKGIVQIQLDGPGFRTTVLYNRAATPQGIQVPATGWYAYYTDKYGHEQVIAPQGGYYNINLDGYKEPYVSQWGTVPFVGGSPVMLREPRP
jgi:hypothetical protein